MPLPVIGKAEGQNTDWHGHVTAITVAPEYRRLGIAKNLMDELERASDEQHRAYFVDLCVSLARRVLARHSVARRYVRCANYRAIEMYEGMGYSVYRRVREYYGSLGIGKGGRDEEDAFGKCLLSTLPSHHSPASADMRKPLSRDTRRQSVRQNGRDLVVSADSVS
jgi:N-terminal acetyltransferase B complex catalytic subunit